MKYMLLAYLNENAWAALSKEQQAAEMKKCEPHVKKLLAAGKVLDGAPLHPTSTATTVREKRRQTSRSPTARSPKPASSLAAIRSSRRPTSTKPSTSPPVSLPTSDDNGLGTTIEVRPIVDYKMPSGLLSQSGSSPDRSNSRRMAE